MNDIKLNTDIKMNIMINTKWKLNTNINMIMMIIIMSDYHIH